jgi:hypothetical protein
MTDGDMFARAVAIVNINIQSREEESLCQATLVMMCILTLKSVLSQAGLRGKS